MTRRLAICALAVSSLMLAGAALSACGGLSASDTGTATAASEALTAEKARETESGALEGSGYITFVVNVHDTVHIDESGDTLLRLIGIYEKYGVRGDFYLTAPVAELYAQQRPDVIERLKSSSMTISYHVRPPHPLYSGFDAPLKGLDAPALAQTLLDYETYRLDPVTGGLDRARPGGYQYVAALLGRAPVVASAPTSNSRTKEAAEQNFASLGAQMTVQYHEEGTDLQQPFEWVNGLLVRPSDFSITRWQAGAAGDGAAEAGHGANVRGEQDPFWWNMLGGANAAAFNPAGYLRARLDEWWSVNPGRPPLITALIHENNFSRSGPEGWTARYYSHGEKAAPLSPPYDMNAPDLSHLRSPAEQEQIWTAYEELVAWSAANLRVVTSEDIVKLAT